MNLKTSHTSIFLYFSHGKHKSPTLSMAKEKLNSLKKIWSNFKRPRNQNFPLNLQKNQKK